MARTSGPFMNCCGKLAGELVTRTDAACLSGRSSESNHAPRGGWYEVSGLVVWLCVARSLDAEKEPVVDPGLLMAQELLGLMKEPGNGSKKELAVALEWPRMSGAKPRLQPAA